MAQLSTKLLIPFHLSSKLFWLLKEKKLRLAFKFLRLDVFLLWLFSLSAWDLHILFVLLIVIVFELLSLELSTGPQKHRHHLHLLIFMVISKSLNSFIWLLASLLLATTSWCYRSKWALKASAELKSSLLQIVQQYILRAFCFCFLATLSLSFASTFFFLCQD